MAKNILIQKMLETNKVFALLTTNSMNEDEMKHLNGGINYLNGVLSAVNAKIEKRIKRQNGEDKIHLLKMKEMNLELLPD